MPDRHKSTTVPVNGKVPVNERSEHVQMAPARKNIVVTGSLTTYLSVDWFRNRSNKHPGITQQHTPDQ